MVPLLLTLLQFVNPGFEFLLAPRVALAPLPTTPGLSAVIGNPAGLLGQGQGLLFSYQRQPLGAYRSLAAGRWNAWGLMVDYQNFGPIEYQDETPNDEGGLTFTPFALHARVGRAFRLDPEVAGGLAVSVVYQRIYDQEYSGLFLSGGVVYAPARLPMLRLGFAFENLGPRVRVAPQVDMNPPLRVAAALAVARARWEATLLARHTTGYADGGWLELGGFVGWQVHPWLFLRLGYLYGNDLYPLQADLRIQRGRLALRLGWLPTVEGPGQTYRMALELHP